MELLKLRFVRPRQVRYQAALPPRQVVVKNADETRYEGCSGWRKRRRRNCTLGEREFFLVAFSTVGAVIGILAYKLPWCSAPATRFLVILRNTEPSLRSNVCGCDLIDRESCIDSFIFGNSVAPGLRFLPLFAGFCRAK